ncbi:MAG: DnaJ domain-containing protein [Sneathiella sp.]
MTLPLSEVGTIMLAMSMSKPKRNRKNGPVSDRICDREDCMEAGEFRAPKSRMIDRGNNADYHWFCLHHIREFNKSWNFFDGMSDDQVLRYKDEDITGHRPTWKLGSRSSGGQPGYVYDDPFDFRREAGVKEEEEKNSSRQRKRTWSTIDAEERNALATLNLEAGCSLKEIKRRHKELAKKYHPDTRGGDKEAEDILKTINHAYTHLLSCGNS